MKKTNLTPLTAEALKNKLWETLQLVQAKQMKSAEANSVAAQSREIMRIVRTELFIASAASKRPGSKLLSFTS